MSARRVQARIPLPDSVRVAIDAMRMRWNPEVATGNPAHVTIVYHDEATDEERLRRRLELSCRLLAPFRLDLGDVRRFPAPVPGAFVAVVDPTGGVERLRCNVLAPPFSPRTRFGLHVTLLHPAQGERLADAWPDLTSLRTAASFVAEHVDLIVSERGATEILATLDLGCRPAAGE